VHPPPASPAEPAKKQSNPPQSTKEPSSSNQPSPSYVDDIPTFNLFMSHDPEFEAVCGGGFGFARSRNSTPPVLDPIVPPSKYSIFSSIYQEAR